MSSQNLDGWICVSTLTKIFLDFGSKWLRRIPIPFPPQTSRGELGKIIALLGTSVASVIRLAPWHLSMWGIACWFWALLYLGVGGAERLKTIFYRPSGLEPTNAKHSCRLGRKRGGEAFIALWLGWVAMQTYNGHDFCSGFQVSSWNPHLSVACRWEHWLGSPVIQEFWFLQSQKWFSLAFTPCPIFHNLCIISLSELWLIHMTLHYLTTSGRCED